MKKRPVPIKQSIYLLKKRFASDFYSLYAGEKLFLVGTSICFVSLFTSWIYFIESGNSVSLGGITNSYSSFSSYIGNPGILILICIFTSIFSLFGSKKKEKIQSIFLVSNKSFFILFLSGVIVSVLCIQSFRVIVGLRAFSSGINYDSGLILCITGSIVMVVGALLTRKEHNSNISGTYSFVSEKKGVIGDSGQERNNMKLPF